MNSPGGDVPNSRVPADTVRLDLRSPLRKLGFAVLCLLLLGTYVCRVLRSYVASQRASSVYPADLERATRLEPSNAEYHHRLGLYKALIALDSPASLESYHAAVRLNPYVAGYWLDLATAYQFTGNRQEQGRALEQAIQVDPRTPDVAWEAGNFYLIQGDLSRALRQFRVVVENDPQRTRAALDLCWRATRQVRPIVEQVLPPTAKSYATFLQALLERNEYQAAGEVWARLAVLGQPIDIRPALFYLQSLLDRRDVTAAYQVWSDLLRANPELASYRPDDNLITNGGFENAASEEVLNGGFDWRYDPVANISVNIDTSVFHSGVRSLAVEFQKQRGEDPGVHQSVAVQPNTEYQFSAFIKADNVEGANGPRFSVTDAYSKNSYFLGDDVLGSTPWRNVTSVFKTGPETRLLAIRIVRVPNNTLLRGRIWIDDISLRQR